MQMARLILISTILLLLHAFICSATVYTVGDSSGWDISTDLDSWDNNKTYAVGDVLLFQYSSYHSVCEVTKENYQGCNTTNVLQSSSNGNTSYSLTSGGDRYFVCGNRLHCLGGMKLHVHVEGNEVASQLPSPIGAPQAQPGGTLPPSSKKNDPTSSSFINYVSISNIVITFCGLLAFLFGIM